MFKLQVWICVTFSTHCCFHGCVYPSTMPPPLPKACSHGQELTFVKNAVNLPHISNAICLLNSGGMPFRVWFEYPLIPLHWITHKPQHGGAQTSSMLSSNQLYLSFVKLNSYFSSTSLLGIKKRFNKTVLKVECCKKTQNGRRR